MAIETRDRTISGTAYRLTQLGALEGRTMLVRLVKLLGPGVGSFVGGAGRGALNPASGADSVLAMGAGEAIHELCARLDATELGQIMDVFAANTTVVISREQEPRLSDVFDAHFAGRYDAMLQWLRWCLEVNFASFFGGAAGNGAKGGPLANLLRALSALQSPPASTGTSTASPAASATPQA